MKCSCLTIDINKSGQLPYDVQNFHEMVPVA